MATPKQNQQKYAANLQEFVSSLPNSKIMFLFFLAQKPEEPVVVTNMGKYPGPFGDWYICPGLDKHYCYAYQESEIKFLVSNLQVRPSKAPIKMYNIDIIKAMTPAGSDEDMYEIANIGNHIDFSVQASKNEVYFSVHYTSYNDGNSSKTLFTRNVAQQCNFLADEKAIASPAFLSNQPIAKLANVFRDPGEAKMVHDLTRACVAGPEKIQNSQQGGVQKPIMYKGLLPHGPECIKFVSNTLIKPLCEEIEYAECIYQYFDEFSTLGKDSGKSMQYVIEFRENRVAAFSISVHRCLKACWADLNKSAASEREKKCLKQWRATCRAVLQNAI